MPNIKIGSKTFDDVNRINITSADGGSTEFATAETIEWHQCPEMPRKFVIEVTYDPNDYTTSAIADYAPASPVVSNYKPIGRTVGDKIHYNEIPGAETSFITSGRYGTVKPLDQVRYINTVQAPNVRDLGGWACDGGTVKYGLLYRGGEPSAADRSVLVDELGVRHDLNLRGSSEATWTVSPLGEDIYFTKADTYNWYTAKVNDAWRTNLRCIFDAVTHGEPVFFHCAAGADRTSTLACVLEGLLGMSQSDIDKDYELACFYSGVGTDNQARRRNEAEWTGLINSINAYDGDTFKDKCVTFAAKLGFTADEINAYRKAMIDGTPDDVTPNITTYDVTNTLTNVTTSNDTVTAMEYQPYEADITVPFGYAINSIKVTMGGKDVTAQVFSGVATNLYRAVTKKLTGCLLDNSAARVIDGQGYVANLKPMNGYISDGESVLLTMGGIDISKYYSNGKIAIPNVTGDIVITATAVESAQRQYVNKMVVQESNLNKRFTTSSISDEDGVFITDPIEVDFTEKCPVVIKGVASAWAGLTNNYGNSKVVFLDDSKSYVGNRPYIGDMDVVSIWKCLASGTDYIGDLTTHLPNMSVDASKIKYVQFCVDVSDTQLSMDDLSGIEIHMLE